VWEGKHKNDLQHFKDLNAGEEGACIIEISHSGAWPASSRAARRRRG
jgi:hypothetical protein